MTYLWTGIVLVAGSHLFSTLLPGVRDGLKQRLGEGPFKGLYSLVNVVGLVLMIVGFRWASPDSPQLYQPVAGANHITMLLVLAAFILIALPVARGTEGNFHVDGFGMDDGGDGVEEEEVLVAA